MAGFDFTDILKKVLGGGVFAAPSTDPTKTGSVSGPVPLAGALPVEEEKPSGNYFSRMFHDDPVKQEALNSGLVNAGAAMMMAGGPSRDPTNLLSVIGRGVGVGNQAYTDYQKDAGETAINNAKMKSEQDKAARVQGFLKGGSGISTDGSNVPYSIARLKEYFELQLANGDEAGARDTLGMIQALQKEAADNGMTIDENGNMVEYSGYNDGLRATEEAKSSGRKAGEKPFETTDDLKELDRVNRERSAAGLAPITTDEWITRQNKEKSPSAGLNSNKFQEEADKKAAERYNTIAEQGAGAAQMIGDMELLTDLGRKAQTGKGAQFKAAVGPYAEAIGVNVEGLSEIQAYQAIVSRIAPNLRPAGSGATSDFDAKQFLLSIPSIGNTAEGNEVIAATMTAISQNKLEAAAIAERVQKNEITWQEGDAEIRKLANPYARFKEYQKAKKERVGSVLGTTVPEEQGDTGKAAKEEPTEVLTVNTPDEWSKVPSGTIVIYNGKKFRKP